MPTATETIEGLVKQEYKYGFVTDVEADSAPPGLNEDIIRLISTKKNEPAFMLEWRLKAFRHWLTMKEPTWPHVHYPPIDYQDISLLLRAETRRAMDPRAWTKSIRNCWRLTKNSAFRCANADASPAWRWTRCLIAFPSAPPSRSSSRKGHHFLFVQRGGAGTSRSRAEISRHGRAVHGQLFTPR